MYLSLSLSLSIYIYIYDLEVGGAVGHEVLANIRKYHNVHLPQRKQAVCMCECVCVCIKARIIITYILPEKNPQGYFRVILP
jgi:hypothetical protein